jgi:glycosyltransferase involved in cell wall biosynthesis
MKIGVDFSRALLGDRTGTEEYAYQLLKNFALSSSSGDNFSLYIKDKTEVDFVLPSRFVFCRVKDGILWTQLRLSWQLFKNPVDVFFVPSHSVPIIHPKKTVVTIHGLEYERFPSCYSRFERLVLKINTLLSIRWSEKIIVPSYNTKRDLIKFYKVHPGKIEVIHHGFASANLKKGSNEHSGFNILFVGRIEKRKNILGIVAAFNYFMKKQTEKGNDVSGIKLILSGKPGRGFEEVDREVSLSPFKNNINLTGYVSDFEKEELYREADLFLFPSLYEGFGLPVLEAMSFGVPVICSNSSSFPEVAGNSAILVEPLDFKNISSAIDKVFSSKEVKLAMIESGYEHLKNFSWQKCAEKTMQILKDKSI